MLFINKSSIDFDDLTKTVNYLNSRKSRKNNLGPICQYYAKNDNDIKSNEELFLQRKME